MRLRALSLNVEQQVLEFCERNSLLNPGDHVVVGVSGGFDSLCLLHLLKIFSARLALKLTAAHLNHQLRGDDAEMDEMFVADTAARWQLPLVVDRQPVAELAARRRQSIEEAARQVRYDFLQGVARKVGASKIAVGHNADDQAETVLMHFLRGTGLSGLRGMAPLIQLDCTGEPETEGPTRLWLIRPLLETSRAEIEAYCRLHQLVPRQDQSNVDTTYFRNRLRYELIPYLESYNPGIRQVLQRTAKVAAADLELLNEQTTLAWRSVAQAAAGRIIFDRPGWSNLPLALKRSTLRRAVQVLRRSLRDIGFEHIERAIEVVESGQAGARASLPGGLMLTLSYRTLTIAAEDSAIEPETGVPYLVPGQVVQVAIPGVTPLPGTGWQLRANLIAPAGLDRQRLSQVERWEAYLDADVVGEAPVLRTRQPGDTFHPFGLGEHSQKVQKFMIDAKIPAALRPHVPLLVADTRILWICGFRLGEPARLRASSRRALHLYFEQP